MKRSELGLENRDKMSISKRSADPRDPPPTTTRRTVPTIFDRLINGGTGTPGPSGPWRVVGRRRSHGKMIGIKH